MLLEFTVKGLSISDSSHDNHFLGFVLVERSTSEQHGPFRTDAQRGSKPSFSKSFFDVVVSENWHLGLEFKLGLFELTDLGGSLQAKCVGKADLPFKSFANKLKSKAVTRTFSIESITDKYSMIGRISVTFGIKSGEKAKTVITANDNEDMAIDWTVIKPIRRIPSGMTPPPGTTPPPGMSNNPSQASISLPPPIEANEDNDLPPGIISASASPVPPIGIVPNGGEEDNGPPGINGRLSRRSVQSHHSQNSHHPREVDELPPNLSGSITPPGGLSTERKNMNSISESKKERERPALIEQLQFQEQQQQQQQQQQIEHKIDEDGIAVAVDHTNIESSQSERRRKSNSSRSSTSHSKKSHHNHFQPNEELPLIAPLSPGPPPTLEGRELMKIAPRPQSRRSHKSMPSSRQSHHSIHSSSSSSSHHSHANSSPNNTNRDTLVERERRKSIEERMTVINRELQSKKTQISSLEGSIHKMKGSLEQRNTDLKKCAYEMVKWKRRAFEIEQHNSALQEAVDHKYANKPMDPSIIHRLKTMERQLETQNHELDHLRFEANKGGKFEEKYKKLTIENETLKKAHMKQLQIMQDLQSDHKSAKDYRETLEIQERVIVSLEEIIKKFVTTAKTSTLIDPKKLQRTDDINSDEMQGIIKKKETEIEKKFKKQMREQNKQIGEYETEVINLRNENEDLKMGIEELTRNLTEKDEQLEEIKLDEKETNMNDEHISVLSDKIAELESQNESFTQENARLNDLNQGLEDRIENANAKVEELQIQISEMEELRPNTSQSKHSVLSINTTPSMRNSDNNNSNGDPRIDTARRRIVSLEDNVDSLKRELEISNATKSQLEEQLEANATEFANQLAEAQSKIMELEMLTEGGNSFSDSILGMFPSGSVTEEPQLEFPGTSKNQTGGSSRRRPGSRGERLPRLPPPPAQNAQISPPSPGISHLSASRTHSSRSTNSHHSSYPHNNNNSNNNSLSPVKNTNRPPSGRQQSARSQRSYHSQQQNAITTTPNNNENENRTPPRPESSASHYSQNSQRHRDYFD